MSNAKVMLSHALDGSDALWVVEDLDRMAADVAAFINIEVEADISVPILVAMQLAYEYQLAFSGLTIAYAKTHVDAHPELLVAAQSTAIYVAGWLRWVELELDAALDGGGVHAV